MQWRVPPMTPPVGLSRTSQTSPGVHVVMGPWFVALQHCCPGAGSGSGTAHVPQVKEGIEPAGPALSGPTALQVPDSHCSAMAHGAPPGSVSAGWAQARRRMAEHPVGATADAHAAKKLGVNPVP